jgi:hypothetical protein
MIQIVTGACDPVGMELTAADFERIPGENLRVPREEFAAVWKLAEELSEVGEWHYIGVAFACRWVACAHVPRFGVGRSDSGPWFMPVSPLTERGSFAEPESIEAETLLAERWLLQSSGEFDDRPGWVEGVATTFAWVWRGSGRPPLEVPAAT